MKLDLLAPPPQATGVWIDPKRCNHFSACKAVQSVDCSALLQPFPRSTPTVDSKRCNVCGECVKSCPNRAIRYVV